MMGLPCCCLGIGAAAVAAVDIGADSSRVARDEWEQELVNGRCLSSPEESVRFLAGSE